MQAGEQREHSEKAIDHLPPAGGEDDKGAVEKHDCERALIGDGLYQRSAGHVIDHITQDDACADEKRSDTLVEPAPIEMSNSDPQQHHADQNRRECTNCPYLWGVRISDQKLADRRQ
ncbi:hypothetical protein D3C71_1412870 [compost metagenome]